MYDSEMQSLQKETPTSIIARSIIISFRFAE